MANDDKKAALDRVAYWNDTYKSTNPTIAGKIGIVLAFAVPYALYQVLPEPTTQCDAGGRVTLLLSLQVIVAIVLQFYIAYTGTFCNVWLRLPPRCLYLPGLQRVPHSPAAAHDPAALAAAGLLPRVVHASNRAFVNTLEQYAALLTASAALVAVVPCDQIRLLPALYLSWGLFRIVYVIGYVRSGSGRMIGFPGSSMPTMVALGYAVYLRVQQGGAFY